MDIKNNFLDDKNIKILLDTLIENNFSNLKQIMNSKNRDLIINTIQQFKYNAFLFFNNLIENNKNVSLIDLNKKFILFILKKGSLVEKEKDNVVKINDKILYTNEDIRSKNLNDFERQYEIKKIEFMNENSNKIPEKPIFEIDIDDSPLKNMNSLLEQMTKQRDYEIQNIYNNYNNHNNSNNNINISNNKINGIDNENNEISLKIVDLNSKDNYDEKQVHWDTNDFIINDNNDFTSNITNIISDGFNIFDKLKVYENDNDDLKPDIEINEPIQEKGVDIIFEINMKLKNIEKKIDFILNKINNNYN